MKKYKAHFSIWQLNEQTPAPVAKLQTIAKGFTGTLTGMVWYTTDLNFAMTVACGGFVIDLLLQCVWLEERK